MRPGKLIRDQAWVAAQPFIPRTTEDEEQAGYEAALTFRDKLPREHLDGMLTIYRADAESANPVTAARARGLIRGITTRPTPTEPAS